MSDTKTADDLVYEVAGILGKAVAGESLGQPEYETIDGKIDGVLAQVRPIIYIGDRDEIPDNVFDTIALIVGEFAGAKFSNAKPDLAAVAGYEHRLRYLVAQQPASQTLKVEYF